jgi:hypothetical protein
MQQEARARTLEEKRKRTVRSSFPREVKAPVDLTRASDDRDSDCANL